MIRAFIYRLRRFSKKGIEMANAKRKYIKPKNQTEQILVSQQKARNRALATAARLREQAESLLKDASREELKAAGISKVIKVLESA